MKQAMNFRLSNHAVIILSSLEERLHCTKTAIIEQALELYAEKSVFKKID